MEIMSLNGSPGERQDAAERAGFVFLSLSKSFCLLAWERASWLCQPTLFVRGEKVNVTRAWPDPRENRAVLVTVWTFGVSKHLDVPSWFVTEES